MIFNFTQLSAYHQALEYVGDDVGELSKLTHNLTDAQAINVLSTKSLDETKMADILVNKGMVKSEAEATAAKIASSQANGVATFSLTAYTAALWANIKAMIVWMATNPVGWILSFGAVIAGTNLILNSYTDTIEEQKERLNDVQSEYEALTEEVNKLNDEIATNDARMQELTAKYEDGTITLIEEDELNKLKLANKLLKEQRDLKQDEQTKKYNKLSTIAKSTFENEYGSAIDSNDMSKYQEYGLQIVAGEDLSNRDLILSIKALYDGIDEAIASGDTMTAENLTEGQEDLIVILQERSNAILGELLDYQSVLELFMNDDGTFADADHQQLWDTIEQWKKEIYRQTSRSGEWNTLQIETALDDTSLENTKKEIEKKFQDETLTTNDIEQFDDLNTALENANLILEEGETPASIYLQYLRQIAESQNIVNATKPDFTFDEANNTLVDQYQSELNGLSEALDKLRNGSFTSIDLVDLLQEFPTLMNETDNLSEAIQTLIDDKLEVLKDKLKDAGASDEILALFDDITNLGKNVQLDEVLSDLDSSRSALKDLKAEISETGKISVSTLQGIITQYPKLEQAANDYLTGKLTEQDIIKALQAEYNEDLSNYYLYLQNKNGADVNFYNSIKDALADDLIEKAKQYGIELSNYKTYNEAKLAMDKQYALKKTQLMLKTDIYEAAEKDVNKHPLNPSLHQQADEAYNDMVIASQKLAEVEKLIEDFDTTVDFVMPSFNTNLNYKPDEDKDSNEEIDWAEQSLSVLQNKVDEFQSVLDNTYGVDNQINAIDDLNDALEDLKGGYEEAQENYEDRYAEALDKLGNNPEIQSKIESGEDFDLTQYDAETAKIIQEAIAAYNKVLETKAKIKDITEQINKNENEEKIKVRLDGYEAQADLIGAMLQDESLTAKERNKLLEKEKVIKNDILQQNILLAKTEDERLRLQEEYNQYLQENEKSQYENTRDGINARVSYYDSRIKDIQNAIALEEAKNGQGTEEQYLEMNRFLDEEIAWETKNRDNAIAMRNQATWGTPEYEYYNDQIQEAQDNINAAKIAQIENNKAIALLPIKPLEDANKLLEQQLELVTKNREEIEQGVSYANMLIQDQVDALNDLKEDRIDHYDDEIKALQEQKDALTESNDEIQRTIDLENAKMALEKAKSNRTRRIYRAGSGFVYESDQDAIREAQNELDRLTRENHIAELDKTIDDLNKQKDDEVEIIEDKIKAWEKYAEKLDKVIESYDRFLALNQFIYHFGADAESKILSQDISILNDFTVALTDVRIREKNLEDQIYANNLAIQAIQNKAEAYADGAITIVAARNTINQVVKDNEEEIQAIVTRTGVVNAYGLKWVETQQSIDQSLGLIEQSNIKATDNETLILTNRLDNLEIFKDVAVHFYKQIADAVTMAMTSFKQIQTILDDTKSAYADVVSYVQKANEAKASVATAPKTTGKTTNKTTSNNKSSNTKNNQVYAFQSDLVDIYHDGGVVGEPNKKELPDYLISLSESPLQPNETLAKLLKGEVVLNNSQMSNLFNNLSNVALPLATNATKQSDASMQISIGDVNVYNPDNSDKIVNEIVKELPLKVIQKLHSK